MSTPSRTDDSLSRRTVSPAGPGATPQYIKVTMYDISASTTTLKIGPSTTASDICVAIANKINLSSEQSRFYNLIMVYSGASAYRNKKFYCIHTVKAKDAVGQVLNNVIQKQNKKYHVSHDYETSLQSVKWYFKDIRTLPLDFGDSGDVSGNSSSEDEMDLSYDDLSYLRQVERRGFMLKRSSRDPNVWKKRYCVLVDKLWFVNVQRKQPRATCLKLTGEVSIADRIDVFNYPYCLAIQTYRKPREGDATVTASGKIVTLIPDKLVFLRSSSPSEQASWKSDILKRPPINAENEVMDLAEIIICDEEHQKHKRLAQDLDQPLHHVLSAFDLETFSAESLTEQLLIRDYAPYRSAPQNQLQQYLGGFPKHWGFSAVVAAAAGGPSSFAVAKHHNGSIFGNQISSYSSSDNLARLNAVLAHSSNTTSSYQHPSLKGPSAVAISGGQPLPGALRYGERDAIFIPNGDWDLALPHHHHDQNQESLSPRMFDLIKEIKSATGHVLGESHYRQDPRSSISMSLRINRSPTCSYLRRIHRDYPTVANMLSFLMDAFKYKNLHRQNCMLDVRGLWVAALRVYLKFVLPQIDLVKKNASSLAAFSAAKHNSTSYSNSSGNNNSFKGSIANRNHRTNSDNSNSDRKTSSRNDHGQGSQNEECKLLKGFVGRQQGEDEDAVIHRNSMAVPQDEASLSENDHSIVQNDDSLLHRDSTFTSHRLSVLSSAVAVSNSSSSSSSSSNSPRSGGVNGSTVSYLYAPPTSVHISWGEVSLASLMETHKQIFSNVCRQIAGQVRDIIVDDDANLNPFSLFLKKSFSGNLMIPSANSDYPSMSMAVASSGPESSTLTGGGSNNNYGGGISGLHMLLSPQQSQPQTQSQQPGFGAFWNLFAKSTNEQVEEVIAPPEPSPDIRLEEIMGSKYADRRDTVMENDVKVANPVYQLIDISERPSAGLFDELVAEVEAILRAKNA